MNNIVSRLMRYYKEKSFHINIRYGNIESNLFQIKFSVKLFVHNNYLILCFSNNFKSVAGLSAVFLVQLSDQMLTFLR